LSYSLDDLGLIPKAARTAMPALVGDVTRAPDYRPGEGVEDTRSEMAIPIRMADRVMGVLDIQSEEIDAFSQAELELMQSLADSVAVALRNAALYAGERRRRSMADTLREVSARLASELELDRVLTDVLEGLRKVIPLNTAAILLVDENANALTVLATTGPDLEGYLGHRVPLDRVDLADEAQAQAQIRRIYQELLNLSEDEPLLMVPLVVGGDQIGYLVTDQPYFSLAGSTDTEVVDAFASQASVAISNARLYAAQQAEAYVTTALLQVAEAANAHVDLDESLQTIARLTALLAGVSRCMILRWEPARRAYYLSAQYGIARDRFVEHVAEPILAERYPLASEAQWACWSSMTRAAARIRA
jgi:sigma-B regulation protein RsbU (phosphoserine phosphatase)